MEDDKSTMTTDDTGLSEEVNTSTNEDTLDSDDLELEDIELSEEELGIDEEETDESDDDEEATESTEDEAEESNDDVHEEEASGDDTASEEDRQKAAQEAYRQREAQRLERESIKAKQQSEYLQGAQEIYDLAIERGLSESEARMEAGRDTVLRQLQIDAYNNRIEGNLNKLENGIDKAVASIDLFQNGSPEVKEELANSLEDFERMYVQRDANGDPVEVKGDVYQYLTQKAESIRRLTGAGARNETKAKSNAKARTSLIPSRAPKTPKVDTDLADFDAEFDR